MRKLAGNLVLVTISSIGVSMAAVPADLVKVTGKTNAAYLK